jgi:general secretion pathway protein K
MLQLIARPSNRGAPANERGVALLTVLTAVAILTIIATDIQYNARVDATLAENGRDELVAYYNAKNALEIELGVLRALRQAQTTLKQFLPNVPMPNVASMLPAECGLLAAFITLNDDSPLPLPGECVAKAIAEKGKIDLNRLGSVTDKPRIQALLLGRLMDPRFDKYWEEEHGNGERVSREELVGYITDYVDLDTTKEGSASGDEDDIYARMKDRYKVKNAPFDSVAELQLIYGIDDALFAELEQGVTVYQVGGVSLATADLPTLAAVVRQSAVNPTDPAFYGQPFELLLTQIMELRALPIGMGILNSTVLVTLGRAVGLSIDEQKLKSFIDDKDALDWYTILATGQMNSVEKRILATYNLATNQMVYFREE